MGNNIMELQKSTLATETTFYWIGTWVSNLYQEVFCIAHSFNLCCKNEKGKYI
jgi:hypothetical protein